VAKHGNATVTDATPVELNPADIGMSNGPRALVDGEFHIHNSGPGTIRITLTSSDLGTNEGYPLASGERETFRHTGSLYVRCPTASSGTPTTFDYITTSGC
jgi:hypothetical protein